MWHDASNGSAKEVLLCEWRHVGLDCKTEDLGVFFFLSPSFLKSFFLLVVKEQIQILRDQLRIFSPDLFFWLDNNRDEDNYVGKEQMNREYVFPESRILPGRRADVHEEVRAGVFRPMTFGSWAVWRGVDSIYNLRLQTIFSDFGVGILHCFESR